MGAIEIHEDTIAAISTPIGTGGIGIVRMSGADSINILKKVFECKENKFLSHKIYYGFILDSNKKKIDEVLVSVMLAPKTYTREDTVEINCHGGLICIQQVLRILFENGARPAEPGEFTKRAYLNGRIDLTQAEAVIDIINSKTELSKHIALNQLSGKLFKKIDECMQEILDILASLEASIDYPDEYDTSLDEIDKTDEIRKKIICVKEKLDYLRDTAHSGKIIHDGINIAIIGKPNVGKSSLLNLLSEKNSAIVTDIPGTTRDVIHEYINLDGIMAKILDTAGIHDTDNSIENLGIEKAKTCAENADVVLLLFDYSREFDQDDKNLLRIYQTQKYIKKVLPVLNKIDLPKKINEQDIKISSCIKISAQKNLGTDNLLKKIKSMVLREDVFDKNNEIFICNTRHESLVTAACNSLINSIKTIDNNMPEDLLSIDLRDAYDFLGQITGKTITDKLTDEIFSKFCVGK